MVLGRLPVKSSYVGQFDEEKESDCCDYGCGQFETADSSPLVTNNTKPTKMITQGGPNKAAQDHQSTSISVGVG